MTEKHILFTGGGTAGHVMVNLALIPYFLDEGWHVSYIGSKEGIERKLIEALDHVSYYPISTGKLRRYMSLENMKDPFRVLKGIYQAWKIIGREKPNIIFSKGGFVSVPVIMAAKLRRVPTIIHESDLTPGLANKLSIPFTKQVLTTFPETKQYLPEAKTTHVGAVIRDELFQGSQEKGFEMTTFTNHKPVLLVMGGSAGSQKINKVIRQSLTNLLKDFQIIHVCGKGQVDDSIIQKDYIQFEYIQDDLKHIFAITDYVVSRAGANAIFEFLALKIPMLLIPLSLAASRGDQIDNAKSFTEQSFALVLDENELDQQSLLEHLQNLQKNRPVYEDAMKTFNRTTARDQIIEVINRFYKA